MGKTAVPRAGRSYARAAALSAGGMVAGLVLCSTVLPAFAAQVLGERQPPRAPETTYAKVCGYCHGRNVGPVILGRHLPVETITYVARHGQNGMPAFRPSEISPSELEALASWISTAEARAGEHGQ